MEARLIFLWKSIKFQHLGRFCGCKAPHILVTICFKRKGHFFSSDFSHSFSAPLTKNSIFQTERSSLDWDRNRWNQIDLVLATGFDLGVHMANTWVVFPISVLEITKVPPPHTHTHPSRYLLGVQLSVVSTLAALLVVAALCRAILFNSKQEKWLVVSSVPYNLFSPCALFVP